MFRLDLVALCHQIERHEDGTHQEPFAHKEGAYIAQVVAGPLLCVGQVLMALGGRHSHSEKSSCTSINYVKGRSM